MNEEQKEKWYKAFTREQLIERCEYLQRSCERKEDTIIDREMEIADLEKGYCELKEKCNKGECDCTHEEYNGMCEENIKMDLEIERLNKENNDLRKLYQRTYKHLFEIGNDELARYFQAQIDECPTFYVEPIIDYYEETKRLHSIIKEVREYINKIPTQPVIRVFKKELLEILDKVKE